MDSFSPLAPSRIRVLVLPVGRIERKRFSIFTQRLKDEASSIPLADIESYFDSGGDLDLSPKSFLQGSLHYNFTTAPPSEEQTSLSPFDLFREPLLVLGVVGGLHHGSASSKSIFDSATAYLRERHPRVVHRQLLVLLEDGHDEEGGDPPSVIGVVSSGQIEHPSLRAAICKLSARFLIELNTYAKALQASPSISTPGQSTASRSKPFRDNDRRPASGHRPSTRGSDSQSPIEDNSPGSRGPPPTSFDQMAATNGVPSALARSNSRASNVGDKGKGSKSASQQDHAPVQSKDKIRARGKARVGVVLGSIYMIAGLWKEALRVLIEHTTKLRSLSDHLWHGKGLENMTICLLLLAWKGVDFQIPALCNPVNDRNSASHVPRLSAVITIAPAAGESVPQATVRRLSTCIPDLSRTILSLYRSSEGPLELPSIVIAEATVRHCKLLAILANHGGELPPSALQQLIAGRADQPYGSRDPRHPRRAPIVPKTLSRNAIADMLAQASSYSESNIPTPEHIVVLSAVASTYALLGLERKKALVVRELAVQLRKALVHARKIGAAEMGIHPAASISTETGAETLLAIAGESGGINKLMDNVSDIYGAALSPESPSEAAFFLGDTLNGNLALKLEMLREFAALCEASPDPYGVLRLTSSLLRVGGPHAALEPNASSKNHAFSREEQLQLVTVIHRTVAVSKHLGLPDALAVYWDPFLVRGVSFPPPATNLAIIDRTKVKAPVDDRIPGNPLLYDPNASRPGTALPQLFVLVKDEVASCLVTFQNPFDVAIEVETFTLVTDGADLEAKFKPTTLGPMRIQSVLVSLHPRSVGETKITACRIKIRGCQEQVFQIITTPWSANAPLTLKGPSGDYQQSMKILGVEAQVVSTVTIDKMPVLELDENEVTDMGLMLLTGEKRCFELILLNTSSTAAHLFEIADTSGVIRHVRSPASDSSSTRPSTASADIIIEPKTSTTIHLEIFGNTSITSTDVNFYYSATNSGTSNHARLISVPIQTTVNPALQALNFEIIPPQDMNDEVLQIGFDLSNAWSQPLSYTCFPSIPNPPIPSHNQSGLISPAELRRIYLSLPLPLLHPSTSSQALFSSESLISNFLSPLKIMWSLPDDDGGDDDIDVRTGQVAFPTPPSLSFQETLSLLRPPPLKLEIILDPSGGKAVRVGTYLRISLLLSARKSRRDDNDGDDEEDEEEVVEGSGSAVEIETPLAVQLVAETANTAATGTDDESSSAPPIDIGEERAGGPEARGSDAVREKRFAVVGTMKRTIPRFPRKMPKKKTSVAGAATVAANIAAEKGGGDDHVGDDGKEVIDFVICPLLAGVLDFEALVHPAWIGDDDQGREERDWCARRRVEIVVHEEGEEEEEEE